MEKYCFSPEKTALLESLPQPLAIYQTVDSQIVTVLVSDGFCKLFGYKSREDLHRDMDQDLYLPVHPDDTARFANAAVRFAKGDADFDIIYRVHTNTYRAQINADTGYRMIHANGTHVDTEDGHCLAYIWYTDEGEYSLDQESSNINLSLSLNNALHEESLLKENRYDYLTGLPNMTYFFELAEAGKHRMQKSGDVAILLFIDPSGMKYFNHKHGFSEGDRFLQAFAKLLGRIFRADQCSHLSQDHFGVFTELEGLEDRLHQLFEECREINNGNSLPLRVGIYSIEEGDVTVSAACDRAKLACDAIRGTFESSFHYYSPDLQDEIFRKQYILENFDEALEKHWIQVYYQPIIRSVSGRVCDEESLARWIDPSLGMLSPIDFIPHLEDAGLIYKLDLYVLEQSLQKIHRLEEAGLHVVPHSINLSRSDFDACDIVEEIRQRVDAAGVARDRITIEITESIIGSDFDFMKEQVARFRSLGFPVWMDDFGSGYSSLDVLQSIRFDLLKFDMGFMKKLHEGEAGKIILTELVKMANSLEIETVCEGVETEEQMLFLQEIGCAKLQGYYFCKPIPLDQLLERYRTGMQIGFEDPAASSYYEAMGRVNLYDFDAIAKGGDNNFQNFFNSLPMGILEINGTKARFARSNQSYQDFVKRFFGLDLSHEGTDFAETNDSFTENIVKTCCEQGIRSVYDEKMPDGSIVHSFARRIGINPVNGNIAVAVAVLSITDPSDGTTYADIARSLASDYYNIYYVDMDTEDFIEYTTQSGGGDIAIERHGREFFSSVKRDTMVRIYEEDRENFLKLFTKKNIVRSLNKQNAFTTTYRVIDSGTPKYVSTKVTRLHRGSNKIIVGVSLVDTHNTPANLGPALAETLPAD